MYKTVLVTYTLGNGLSTGIGSIVKVLVNLILILYIEVVAWIFHYIHDLVHLIVKVTTFADFCGMAEQPDRHSEASLGQGLQRHGGEPGSQPDQGDNVSSGW